LHGWVVITGGCGYVGSHIASTIKNHTGYKTLVIDSRADGLEHTHAYADEIINGDFAGKVALDRIRELNPKAVFHCAASSLVGPSMTDPGKYYDNNVSKLKTLLDCISTLRDKNIVFSSSSSVYGDGDGKTPCGETDHLDPISPYGKTKMIGEMMISDYCMAYGVNGISFRYFNAVGADPNAMLGQEPNATHLLARIMESMSAGSEFIVYGNDYPTADGTCIRDYVHVSDIARAHLIGLNHLIRNPGYHVYNIGSGRGYSVMEIINAVERFTYGKVNVKFGPRRPGDPAWRAADTRRIRSDLAWRETNDLEQIVLDTHRWYNSYTFKNIGR
jgi:UDP-glucose-4-epimerase GalE